MRTYWICQVLGWLAYSGIGITINLLNGVDFGPLLVGHFVLIVASIGLTHWLRSGVRSKRASGATLRSMSPFLVGRVLAISMIQAVLVIGTNILVTGNGWWSMVASVSLWWGMLLATGVWTILYLKLTERRVFSARETELKLALRESELRVLESQINPHFLFNCLNSIRALVEINPPKAQDMLTRLGNVLRNSLRHDRQHTVPLAGEVEAVSDYLALEGIRFEERLRHEVLIAPDALHCQVPPMVVQTLVENAIKHGIGQLPGKGQLTVRAERSGDTVRLVVENTGRLRKSESGRPPLGLQNLRTRLQLLYGDRGQLSLADCDGMVRATVVVPTDC